MIVEGWACARAGWCQVAVRKAWWRTEAAHARSNRRACAKKVVAEGRSRRRFLFTALRAFAPLPRAPESSAYRIAGVGTSNDVPTKAGMSAGTPDCGLEHHAPWLGPGARRRGERGRESAPGGRRLAMGLSPRHPLVRALPGGLDGGSRLAEQDGRAGEAKDASRPAVGGDDVDDLGGGHMTLATDEDVGRGPVAPQR